MGYREDFKIEPLEVVSLEDWKDSPKLRPVAGLTEKRGYLWREIEVVTKRNSDPEEGHIEKQEIEVLYKIPDDQDLPQPAIERIVSVLGEILGVAINRVQLYKREDKWASLHHLVPGPVRNLDEDDWNAIRRGVLSILNSCQFRSNHLFNLFVHNEDVYPDNLSNMILGGVEDGRRGLIHGNEICYRYIVYLVDQAEALDGDCSESFLQREVDYAGGIEKYVRKTSTIKDFEGFKRRPPSCRQADICFAKSLERISDDHIEEIVYEVYLADLNLDGEMPKPISKLHRDVAIERLRYNRDVILSLVS